MAILTDTQMHLEQAETVFAKLGGLFTFLGVGSFIGQRRFSTRSNGIRLLIIGVSFTLLSFFSFIAQTRGMWR